MTIHPKVYCQDYIPGLYPPLAPEHRLAAAVCMEMGNLCTGSDIAPGHQRTSLFYTYHPLYGPYVVTFEDIWIRRFLPLPHCLSETNRNLEWKPNTNKGNKVNSNRWKKSSGRHLVWRNAPSRESQDDWKKRNLRQELKKPEEKVERKSVQWNFFMLCPTSHSISANRTWVKSCLNCNCAILKSKDSSQSLSCSIFPLSSLETTRGQENSGGQSYGPRSCLFHSWLSRQSRTEEEDSQRGGGLCGQP